MTELQADFVWDADRLLDWSSLRKLDLTHMIVHGYKETAASRLTESAA